MTPPYTVTYRTEGKLETWATFKYVHHAVKYASDQAKLTEELGVFRVTDEAGIKIASYRTRD